MKTNFENNANEEHIPAQQTGTGMNVVEKIILSSEAETVHFFQKVRKRLLDINHWAEIAGIPMSTFKLTDSRGNDIQRKATDGDYLRINIPGPGTKTGGGYDWVRIEEIKEELQNETEILTKREENKTA